MKQQYLYPGLRRLGLAVVAAALFTAVTHAQLSGTLTIPGSYPTIAAAVTDLNAQGVGSGGVTFNVAAGYTETLSSVISLTATGTANNPIIFQKSGGGANPLITSYTGGSGTPGTASQDGIWRLVGSDYVTIDGIDLEENAANTTNPSTMEYGYGLYRASTTDGCQYVTIQNCTIILNRINNATGTAPMIDGSVGIHSTNATPAAATTVLTIASAAGTNSYNRFYANTIQNCNIGIGIVGFAASSPFSNADTGNDVGGNSPLTGNTIRNFGGGGTANPAAGVRTLAQYGINVSYNTFNNNDGNGINHAGTLRAIFLNTATSASATVAYNTITLKGGGTTSTVSGIENASGSTAANNTINLNNNSFTGCEYLTATSGSFYFVYNTSSAANVNMNNNTISGLTYSAVSLAGSGTIAGIYNTGSVANCTGNGNIISGFTMTGTTGATTHGVYFSSGTNQTANNNQVYNFTQNGTGTSGTLYGIRSTTATVVHNGNTIYNLVNNKTTGTSPSYGIYNLSSPTNETYNNNTIYNITHAGVAVVSGIHTNTAAGVRSVSGNLIYTLASGGGTVYGLYQLNSTPTIVKNKIYDLTSTGTGGVVYGIHIGSGNTSVNIINNLVGDLKTPTASATSDAIRGINIVSTTTTSNINVYYNTVYINATSSGTNFHTSGIFHTTSATATTAALNMINNIIVNLSTPNGSGITSAYRRSTTTLTNYGNTSNNNLLYAGTPGASRLIFYDGTNADQTLGAFKTRVGPVRELYSVTENAPFQSTTGASPNFLHINPGIATQAESGGINITGITDDFDGHVRQGNIGYSGMGSAPDIGADELDATLLDLLPPVITYAPLLSGCGTGDRLVTGITITDATGVPTGGSLRPRIYYKKGIGGAWYSQPGTLASGTAQNGSWNFTVVAADMGGLVLGDQVYYYIIAQDASVAASIASNPSAGLSATDVNTVNTPPTTPNSYSVIDILAGGTYTVGSGGNYATLTAAVADYNSKCIGGPIIFSLTDAAYDVSETFPITINQNSGASAINTLTIRPAANNTVAITGSVANNSLIKVLGNYVTINGSNNSSTTRDLTIANNSLTTPSVVLFGSTGTVPITNSHLLNTIVINGVNTSSAVYVSDGTTASAAGYFSQITIRNNSIQKAYVGIYTNAVIAAGNGAGLVLDSNDLTASGANAIRFVGLYVQGADGATVSANRIANFETASNEDDKAIWFATGTRNSNIVRNKIDALVYSGTGGYGPHGIYVTTGLQSAGINVVNNMISGLTGDGYDYTNSTYTLDNPTGILLSTTQSGVNIYYNTISMSGNTLNQTNAISCGIRLNTGSVANIRDNIVSNTLGLSGSTGYGAIGILVANIAQLGTVSHNDYYVNPTGSGNKFIGQIGSTGQSSLGGWQSATGQEANSLNIQPNFLSPTDLHMDPVTNLTLDNTGTPIPGIATDIDGNSRSLTAPDMGADEFISPACVGASGGTISPASYNICNNQTIALSSSGADAGIGISYQWKVASVSGGPYVNVSGGTGANTIAYTSAPLPAGTYYYVLETQCSFGSLVGLSNEATVVVNPYPTASASNDSPVCEGLNVNLTGTTDIGVTYAWTGPAGFTSSALSPGLTGLTTANGGAYVFVATANGCSSQPDTTIVTVNPGIPSPTATASQTSICLGDTIDLNVTAGGSGLLISEDFNGLAPGWTTVNNSSGGTPANAAWTLRNSPYNPGGAWTGIYSTITSNDVTQFYFTNGDAQGNGSTANTILQAPVINAAGLSGLTLDFYHYYRDINDAGDNANVEVSTDGINWTSVQTYTADQGAPTAFANAIINLNAYVGSPTLHVRFRYTGTWDWGWAIDNVTINGTYPSFNYSWTSNPAGFTSNLQNPAGIIPATSTAYDVVITNSFGCSDTTGVSVTVNQNPTVSIGNDATYCQGVPFSTTYDAGNPGSSYNWSTGAQTQTINAAAQGTYSVIVTDVNGCLGYDTAVVTEFASPQVNIGNDTAYCQGVSFSTVLDAGNPGETFNWNTGAQTQTINVTNSGTYSVIVTNTDNCSGYDTLVVTENLAPVVNIGNDTAYCQGTMFSDVYDAGNPGNVYNWSTGAQTQTISVNNAGTYSVMVTDGNGCEGYDTVVVTQNPSPVVSLGADIVTQTGPVVLDAGNAGSSFNWSTGAQTQTISVNSNGTYSVIVTNGFGCSDSDTIIVTFTASVINEDGSAARIILYPNPAVESIHISIEDIKAENLSIEMLDMSGRLLHNDIVKNPSQTFIHSMDVFHLPAGAYMIRLTTEHGTDVLRWIKK